MSASEWTSRGVSTCDFSGQPLTASVSEEPGWQTTTPRASGGWSTWDVASTPTLCCAHQQEWSRTEAAAAEIHELALELLDQYDIRIVVIMELLIFPVHGTTWCQRVNYLLRERVRASHRIWFWRHGRKLFSLGSCSSRFKWHGSVLERSETASLTTWCSEVNVSC